ncbi:hypothetical protein FEM48_Zijuj04G0074600 [Ziziphus jujuba var. spinosa]|uniref:glutamate formimidoyltransferase n=1 Tax=Ziziphus jujuba var. spinosa TaxID=714518 RepID=A0A978VIK8_ZIZJJ|nr:hypothetical protein FEM48_Zijuj04G0074600 [Ziziphus jujuba var. spinosa]
MLKSMLACCKVYISESRNRAALDSIERAAKLFPEVPIINKFEDKTYNRVGYTLVTELASKSPSDPCPMKTAVFAMVKAAFENIDLESHSGSHPRTGVVDHICFHPLLHASLDQAAAVAKSLASDVGYSLQVPTFLYGAAHKGGRTLDAVRRELGYFKPNDNGNLWTGGPNAESLALEPDVGPTQVPEAKGVIVIGATRWVDNYNVPVFSTDIASVRKIAKRVSGRGGGLPSVQAMALTHGETVIEVACNLLEPNKVGGERVQLEVERLAKEEGAFASQTVGTFAYTGAGSLLSQRSVLITLMAYIFVIFLKNFSGNKPALAANKTEEEKKWITAQVARIWISESRNHSSLQAIEGAAKQDPESVIVNKFEDRAYNRVRYTIVSYVVHDSTGNAIYSPLHQTVIAMAEAAYGAINFELHSGAHPRLGVVDDILFHPLRRASLDEAAWLAKAVALDIGSRFQVPIFLYGAAHPTGKAPDTIRRELGFYRPNFNGIQWAGRTMPEILPEKPDEGPTMVPRARGITLIGAGPWFAMYNIPIMSTDVSAARRIARMVSARGGGLPTVQSLGLVHGEDSTEIACMLLQPNQIGADRVQNRVEMLAAEEGFDVEQGYFTDYSPEKITEKYMKLISAAKD